MVFMNLGGYAEINVNETNVGIVISPETSRRYYLGIFQVS